jgi:thymidine phosphorylase
MLFTDVIRRKRDGGELDATQVQRFVDGLSDGSLPAEQVSALAMAILLRSMTRREAGLLTRAMAASGSRLEWDTQALGGPVVDKHSTGGVGDKVSLVLAPVVAACGGFVPMISGRGLGHTGGTLDKLESIPGYQSAPSLERLRQVVAEVGCAIIGQTDDLAPADRRLYAIRDVTATVESIPLITASILSKKIAAGNEALVMDIKVGSGAFMATPDDARELAHSLVGTAAAAGLPTHALITDMNEVLGRSAGNALELAESIAYLRGDAREPRLHGLVLDLAAEMLVIAGLEAHRRCARERAEAALEGGDAAECFAAMVRALGGPADLLDRPGAYLARAPVRLPVAPARPGHLAAVDARAVGTLIVDLGGGRQSIDDTIDPAVGLDEVAPIGSVVGPDAPLATVHAATAEDARRAAAALIAACRIEDRAPDTRAMVLARITPADLED